MQSKQLDYINKCLDLKNHNATTKDESKQKTILISDLIGTLPYTFTNSIPKSYSIIKVNNTTQCKELLAHCKIDILVIFYPFNKSDLFQSKNSITLLENISELKPLSTQTLVITDIKSVSIQNAFGDFFEIENLASIYQGNSVIIQKMEHLIKTKHQVVAR